MATTTTKPVPVEHTNGGATAIEAIETNVKAVEDAFAKVWPRMKTGDIQEASVSVSPANAAPADNHIHIYVYNSPPGGMIKINAPSGSESFDNFEGVPRL